MRPEPSIEFHYEAVSFRLREPQRITAWLISVMKEENREFGELNFVFCQDEYLLALNRQYLQHDYYTDILSFPLREDPVEGDIFISTERVADNAGTLGIPFETELRRVMVHGILHFLGYNDHEEEDIRLIRQKEDHYIALWQE